MKKANPEFDHPTRGKNYKKANEEMPLVRKSEIDLMLKNINAQKGEAIVDFGCGNGVVTYSLAKQVGTKGKIIALDNSKEILKDLLKKKNLKNIETGLLHSERIPLPANSVNAVVTLANLHHIPNKEIIFKEFARILKNGGRLVIGDVADKTNVQKYFDGPVDRFCSTGHKHRYLDKKWAKDLCLKSGLNLMKFSIEDTPWTFEDEEQAKWFLQTIHDATCTPEKCLKEAKDYLGHVNQKGKFLLKWKLFYLVAKK